MKFKNIGGRDINPEHVVEITRVIDHLIEELPLRRGPENEGMFPDPTAKKVTYRFRVQLTNAPEIHFTKYKTKEEAEEKRKEVIKELQS